MSTINDVENYLNEILINRKEEVDSLISAVCSGEHMLLLGPPGTAKSQLVREFSSCISDCNVFYSLISYHMNKEELFGPLSLSSLREDKFEYKTEGYLPTANIAYLDEIGKCHPNILNTMLMVLNEREFINGASKIKCPLITCIGTSNELFEDGAEALYDRFIFRHAVTYLSRKVDFFQLQEDVRDKKFRDRPKISLRDIQQIRKESEKVNFHNEIIRKLWKFKNFLEEGDEPIFVSDRNWVKIQKISKVRAAIKNRKEVDSEIMSFLKNVCWEKPEEKPKVESAYRRAFIEQVKINKVIKMNKEKNQDFLNLDKNLKKNINKWEQDVIHTRNKKSKKISNINRLIKEGELILVNLKKIREDKMMSDDNHKEELKEVEDFIYIVNERIDELHNEVEVINHG